MCTLRARREKERVVRVVPAPEVLHIWNGRQMMPTQWDGREVAWGGGGERGPRDEDRGPKFGGMGVVCMRAMVVGL